MENKPRIFIGSSSEGLEVAKLVKKYLSDFAECVIWNEGVFRFNNSYFDTLLNIINFYDYGVLVATGDDFTNSRDVIFEAPRDNVVFEFGLFLGRLGKNKVFLMREDKSKLPSDITGITLPHFPKEKGAAKTKAISHACKLIIEDLKDRANTFDLGLLPSLSLANAYFMNFVEHTGKALFDGLDQQITVRIKDGKDVKEKQFVLKGFKLNLLIPDELKKDVKTDVFAAKFKGGWKEIEINTGQARWYNLYMDKAEIENGFLQLYDVPTILNALTRTLNMYLQKSHYGKAGSERLLETREMNAFRKVLDYEINLNSCFEGRVVTEVVNI